MNMHQSHQIESLDTLVSARPILVLMVGLPRSGKTSFIQEKIHDVDTPVAVVNPDSIRRAMCPRSYFKPIEHFVWGIARVMVNSLFLSGHKMVILDACNNTSKRREEWYTPDREIGVDYEVHYIVMSTSERECIVRAKRDCREDLIPVIERMGNESDWREW